METFEEPAPEADEAEDDDDDDDFGLPVYTLHGSTTNVGEDEKVYFELISFFDDQKPIINLYF